MKKRLGAFVEGEGPFRRIHQLTSDVIRIKDNNISKLIPEISKHPQKKIQYRYHAVL
ncbi:MAG: hypothetical protein V7723_10470 [Sneathiella sp.]|uniref:hypothetical protein n=1 Tax=Sneathiella sp. TaxID=1964365 RepID=UPI00300299AA